MFTPSIILMWPRIVDVGAIDGPGVGSLLGLDDEGSADDGIDEGSTDKGIDEGFVDDGIEVEGQEELG